MLILVVPSCQPRISLTDHALTRLQIAEPQMYTVVAILVTIAAIVSTIIRDRVYDVLRFVVQVRRRT